MSALTPVKVPVQIQLKDKSIDLKEDNITLYTYQVDLIKKAAIHKTEKEWLESKRGVKIPLRSEQKRQILCVKDDIINLLSPSRSPQILLMSKNFGFTKHAVGQALKRIEKLTEDEIRDLGPNYMYSVQPETLEKIAKSLIDSKVVASDAEWKGFPFLNFTFVGEYDNKDIEIVVNFEFGILIITLIVVKETGFYIREVYRFNDKGKLIKKPFS
jgi:hypothetical protein